MYQITSGSYRACCGIAGPFMNVLPDAEDAFIELSVDQANQRAQMRILGQDMRTVKHIPPESCRGEFVYAFTNGVVYPDRIQFGMPGAPSLPGWPSVSLVVSNSADTLSLNGSVLAPCPGSADLPEEFLHTNVAAMLMPIATIRVSEVEVTWNTVSNRVYQVQYRSALTTNAWVNWGAPVTGTASMKSIQDAVPADRPQRYYRLVVVP